MSAHSVGKRFSRRLKGSLRRGGQNGVIDRVKSPTSNVITCAPGRGTSKTWRHHEPGLQIITETGPTLRLYHLTCMAHE